MCLFHSNILNIPKSFVTQTAEFQLDKSLYAWHIHNICIPLNLFDMIT